VVAAALACGQADSRAAMPGGPAERLLRDALPLAGDEVARIQLQAFLGRALASAGDGEQAQALGEEALAAAREVGDFECLGTALVSVLFNMPGLPANLDRRIDLAREFTELARAEGDLGQEAWALGTLLFGCVACGELAEARAAVARHRDVTRQIGEPMGRALSLQVQALLAVGEGRFAEAEAMAAEANEIGSSLSGGAAPGGYGVQLFSIRREQGRLDEARPIVEAIARLGSEDETWRPALAVLYADLGITDQAAAEVRHLVGQELSAVPRDSLWESSLSYLADACAAVEDRDAAAVVYRELLPYRGLVVQVGYLLAAYGAADRYLGVLAALLGRPHEAEAHFEAAIGVDSHARMPVWMAHTQLEYGRFLASRAERGDLERATELLHSALETAQNLGMATVTARAIAALDQSPASP
jgi:tetratricopeptide (TPR) repeat protein